MATSAVAPVVVSSESSQAGVVAGRASAKSLASDVRPQTSPGVCVRELIAQQVPSLDIISLLGQHKGVGMRLPTIKRSSPYYPTLSLRRSSPEQAKLQEMLAHSSTSSEEGDSPSSEEGDSPSSEEGDSPSSEEGDRPDVAPPPYTVRQGGDGSDVQCTENVCPPQTADPTHSGVWPVSPKPKRTSWDSVLPSDELFPLRHQRSAVLSADQQAVEEVQTGHWDVICTLRAREQVWVGCHHDNTSPLVTTSCPTPLQLIPNVCRLWSEDKALQAVANTLQMCLTENEEDVALLVGVLGVFMEIP